MRHSTAALIVRGQRLLFAKRPHGGALSDCWELPGGKVDNGEAPREGLLRELEEELGVRLRVGEEAGRASFEHRGVPFVLIGFWVRSDLASGVDPADIRLHEHVAAEYLLPEEAADRKLAPSDQSLLENIGWL